MENERRVDNLPLWLRPLVWAYGLLLGSLSWCYFSVIYWTNRIEINGREKLEGSPQHIFSVWHDNAVVYFCAIRDDRNQVWLSHPAWYMKGVHFIKQWRGIKTILGSTGHSGREAADRLIAELKQGISTTITPDGPSGPYFQLHKGILHVALATGFPIVPIRFECSLIVRSWEKDKKKYPLPFGKIKITYGKPYYVTHENFDSVAFPITQDMT